MKFGDYGYTLMSYSPNGYDVDDLVMAAAYDWRSYFKRHGFKAVVLTERVYEESLQDWIEAGTIVYRIEYDTADGRHFKGLFPMSMVREDPEYFFEEFLADIDDAFLVDLTEGSGSVEEYLQYVCGVQGERHIDIIVDRLEHEARMA